MFQYNWASQKWPMAQRDASHDGVWFIRWTPSKDGVRLIPSIHRQAARLTFPSHSIRSLGDSPPVRPPVRPSRGFLNRNDAITKSSLTWAVSSCLPPRPPPAPPKPRPHGNPETNQWVQVDPGKDVPCETRGVWQHSDAADCLPAKLYGSIIFFCTPSPLPGKYVYMYFFFVEFGRNSRRKARWNVWRDL